MQGLIDTGDALVDAARGAARLLGLLAAEGEGGDLFATVAARLEDAADDHWEALREADGDGCDEGHVRERHDMPESRA